MADAKVEDGCEDSHVVVWDVSTADMVKLDKIESTYNRVPCQVRLYDDSVIQAWVYSQPKASEVNASDAKQMEAGTPSERYIDIITRGATAAGIKKEYIDWVNSVPNIPRTKPADFKTFPVPENPKVFTAEELKTHLNAVHPAPIFCALNGKVFKFTTEKGSMRDKIYRKHSGKDITLFYASALYEPMYPPVTTVEAMSAEHKAWVEDISVSFSKMDATTTIECLGILAE
jgi:hypothetical protein